MNWTRGQVGCGLAFAALLSVAPTSAQRLTGRIKVDGSSTVGPAVTAAAEMFRETQPKVQITVGISGTGGGFKKFLESEPSLRTDISDASRPISAEEAARAKSLGIEFLELPLAYDGLSVVVHKDNAFCDHLTVEELKRIWAPDSTIRNWKDVRAGFPDLPLKLYGPGTDSGTFDYFTEVIVGKAKSSRSDYSASEDDNVLVQGVAGDRGALGYFGYGYYEENRNRLKLVAIDGGDGKPVLPSPETVRDGSYHPLGRPLFIYVNKSAAARPEVAAFVRFALTNARRIVEHPSVQDIALGDSVYAAVLERFEKGVTGTLFADAASRRKPLEQVYRAVKAP